MGKLDANNVYQAMGVSEADGETALPLLVSASTGRLLVEIVAVADTTSTQNDPKIDDNRISSGLVVDDNGDVQPLLIDSRNGYLFADVNIE